MCPEAYRAVLAALVSSLLTRCGVLCREQTLVGGQSLNDDRWHSLFVRRRANVVQLGVDNALQSTGEPRLSAVIFSRHHHQFIEH